MAEPESWIQDAQATLQEARQRGQPVGIEGHGSKAFYGNPRPAGAALISTRGYAGIVNHDPTELVVVARAGTPITALEACLAERGQALAFEPPRFGPDRAGTVGGMVATGLSGPARLSAGSCRDALLGLTVLNSSGELMRFGGTVMKNVAGYDMTRLHAGAMGTLGLVLDVALKVLPRPKASLTLSAPMGQAEALTKTNSWLAQPLPISASAWLPEGELVLRLAGAQAAVQSAADRLTKSLGPSQARVWPAAEATDFWEGLRDHRHPFFTPAAPHLSLWRLSLPPTQPVLGLAGAIPLIEWGGAQRWIWSDLSADVIRGEVSGRGGHATCFRRALPDTETFSSLSEPLMRLHARIKAELDPHLVLEPGRLYRGL